jgi:hypothetical protein
VAIFEHQGQYDLIIEQTFFVPYLLRQKNMLENAPTLNTNGILTAYYLIVL